MTRVGTGGLDALVPMAVLCGASTGRQGADPPAGRHGRDRGPHQLHGEGASGGRARHLRVPIDRVHMFDAASGLSLTSRQLVAA